MVTRSPTASIAAVVAVVLLPQTAGGLLGGLQPWVIGASPGTVVAQLVGNGRAGAAQAFPPGIAAAAVTPLGVAAVIAAGGWALLRRDGSDAVRHRSTCAQRITVGSI